MGGPTLAHECCMWVQLKRIRRLLQRVYRVGSAQPISLWVPKCSNTVYDVR